MPEPTNNRTLARASFPERLLVFLVEGLFKLFLFYMKTIVKVAKWAIKSLLKPRGNSKE